MTINAPSPPLMRLRALARDPATRGYRARLILSPDEEARRFVRTIVEEVCTAHGVTRSMIRGSNRNRKIARARQEICYRAAQETGASYSDIARQINRDRTTVNHAIRMHAQRHGLGRPRGVGPPRDRSGRRRHLEAAE